MAWVIVLFSDLTVSSVSVKWLRKNGKKCYFPKTKIKKKIKTEAEVDKESGKWTLYSCRLLMSGKIYDTYEEALKAEIIAQNHSTMSSFENSYSAKQGLRKRSNAIKSASESESEDFKNIKELSKLDAELSIHEDKDYNYNRDNDASYDSQSSMHDGESEDDKSMSDSGDQNYENDANIPNESSSEENENISNVDDTNNVDMSQRAEDESNFTDNIGIGLESTSELRGPESTYDFSDDRCLLRIEKLIMHACQQLESIKTEMKAMKEKSDETESVVQKLVTICRDLSFNVFACTEEIKKRNGMFTDLLVPDIKMPVRKRKQFYNNETAFGEPKIVDNMIKYLASTINETKEKNFVRSCITALFDMEFFVHKVWWKKEPNKVLIKNSQILHCMKESYKAKFGLVEPRKTDKEVENFIHKTCTNMKDSYRKSTKSTVYKDHERTEIDSRTERRKKSKKKSKAERDYHDGNRNLNDGNFEENLNAAKKAKKAREKAKQASQAFERVGEEYNAGVEEAESDENSRNRKRNAEREGSENAKNHKKKK